MTRITDILQDRIHSTAKVHALERSPISATGQALTQSASPTTPKAAPQNALPRPAPRSTTSHKGLEKQLDASADSSPSGSDAAANVKSAAAPPPAPPPDYTKEAGEESAALDSPAKPSLVARARAGSKRFVTHTKDAICHSWINVLLIFVPIGIAVNYAPLPHSSKPTIVFAMNAVAIIPLAGLLSHATESVASRMGDTLASLLNVTFGNAVELIIFVIALAKREIRIVQASILGSILANLLLILGMAFTLGGLRYQEQVYNNTVTQMSACLLSLSVISLLLPTAFHASFSDYNEANNKTIQISRGTSVILLLVYVLYLLFQLKSHAYMYVSTPQQVIDEESHPGVLAEMMNASSSDDSSSSSSSSSSSDSDSDNGSHTTKTRRRIKRAFRNRKRTKSSTSSTQATSVPSAVSSLSIDETGEEYFGQTTRTRAYRDEDKADGDDTHERGMPRVRDFETEQGDVTASPERSLKERMKKQKRKTHKKSKSKAKKTDPAAEQDTAIAAPSQPISGPQVDLVQEPEELPGNSSSKRQFPMFRPPLPSVFSNTVFSNPPRAQPSRGNLAGLSIPREPASDLRRANSLPDRLALQTMGGRQQHVIHSNTEPAQRGGQLAVHEVHVLGKVTDEETLAPQMSRTAAVMLLLVSTGLVAFCAELLVDVIPEMVDDTSVSQTFIGLIVLPIVGNAAEHVTAVTVAAKNKMDLAIGVAVGSSIQIALFITPVVVLLGWIMDRDMSLYFSLFETVSLFVTVFVVNFLVLDGRSNYLEGALLMAAYVIIAVAAFFYPNSDEQSRLGGGNR